MQNNDLISRAALLKEIEPDMGAMRGVCFFGGRSQGKTLAMNLEALKRMIIQAPAVDAEPVRHGYWIRQDNTFTRYMCSECKSKNHGGHEKFCPECGAKMDKTKAGE